MVTKNEEALNALFEELVPSYGKADSLAGEIVRAACRIGYRYFNDGDHVGVGYGNETCNAAARFLLKHTNKTVACFLEAMWGQTDEEAYEVMLDLLSEQVVKFVAEHPELRNQETEDMHSYYDATEDEAYLDEEDNDYDY